MRLGLVGSEKDAVPWRPLGVFVPAHEDQVIEVLPSTQHTLATPDVLHQVAQVSLLQWKEAGRCRAWIANLISECDEVTGTLSWILTHATIKHALTLYQLELNQPLKMNILTFDPCWFITAFRQCSITSQNNSELCFEKPALSNRWSLWIENKNISSQISFHLSRINNKRKVSVFSTCMWLPTAVKKHTTHLHEESNLGAVLVSLFWESQCFEHPAVVAVVMANTGVVVELQAAAALAHVTRVGGQVELRWCQVLVAWRAEVYVLPQRRRILGHLVNKFDQN